jgi:hypothetical protein
MVKHFRGTFLFLSWALVIFATSWTERISVNFSHPGAVKYLMILGLVIGIGTVLIYCKRIILFPTVFLIFIPIAIRMFISDPSEFQSILYMVSYAIIVYNISKRYPLLIFKQYMLVCVIIGVLSVVDFCAFFLIDEFIISQYTSNHFEGIPRISTIFDEMSHQAYFVMPAVVLSLIDGNTKHRILLMFALFSTFSVSAFFVFVPITIIALITRKRGSSYSKMNPYVFLTGLIIFLVAVYVSHDYIFSKLINLFIGIDEFATLDYASSTSVMVLYSSYDLITNTDLFDLMVGGGYYNNGLDLIGSLSNSVLYDAYLKIGLLDNVAGNAYANMIVNFGLLHCFIILMILIIGIRYSRDRTIYILALLVMFGQMIHNPHTVLYSTYIFLIAGLAWTTRNDVLLHK